MNLDEMAHLARSVAFNVGVKVERVRVWVWILPEEDSYSAWLVLMDKGCSRSVAKCYLNGKTVEDRHPHAVELFKHAVRYWDAV